MVSITGNLEVDYIVTVAVGLISSIISNSIILLQRFVIDYPDIAGPVFIIIGAFILYYFIKNAVKIIYSLIVTIIKSIVIFSILLLFLWIYLRGFETFQTDFKNLIHFTKSFDQKAIDNISSYSSQFRGTFDFFNNLSEEINK